MSKLKNLKFKNCNAGFTMVELLTSMFVFSILAVIISSIFVRALDIERRAFSAQIIQESALAVLETMAKEIRVGRVENQNNNCTTDPVKTQLIIIHPILGQITYRLSGSGVVERVIGSDTYYLSFEEVLFNRLRFCVTGSTLPFDSQPSKITILTSISNRTGRVILTKELQTTVTSRYLNNEI